MNGVHVFNNYDYIKLNDFDISMNMKFVVLYARFMRSANWTLRSHMHSFYELHFPLEGSCSINLQNSTDVTIGANDYLLIHPKTQHQFTSISDDFYRLSIAFDIQQDNKTYAKNDMYSVNRTSEKINGYFKNLQAESAEQSFGYRSIVNLYIQMIIIEFLRMYPFFLNDGKTIKRTEQQDFYNALNFIRNNISGNISTEDVAKSINMSSRQLNRIFKANIKTTIADFIRIERSNRVMDHLKKTDLSMQEIAVLTGFNDEYTLNKVFKKTHGISPGKYRSIQRKKDSKE